MTIGGGWLRQFFLPGAALLVLWSCGSEGPVSPATGTVEVTASTTGDDIDPDGYTFTVNGGSQQSLTVTGTSTVANVPEGGAEVELSGVAGNCSVSGQNPRTVQVTDGGTASTTFEVACTARQGSVEVTTTTTGDELDPDGYTVELDGTSIGAVGINETRTFSGIDEGTHTLSLSGVAPNCTVASNDQSVSVAFDGTATVTFDVACSSTTGDLEVKTSTTGQDVDPEGYTVTIDPGTATEETQAIGLDETLSFPNRTTGVHVVELSAVAYNCAVSGDNPRTVTVTESGVSTTFDVSCSDTGQVPLDNQIVFESDRDDPGGNFSIYTMSPDGTDVRRLTDPAHDDRNPHVSPDGTKILFQSGRGGGGPDVFMMNADGSNVTSATGGFGGYNPKWSPLGDKFVWTRPVSGNAELWIMDDINNPGQRRQLTDSPGFDDLGTWSPDGSTIAFTSVRCEGGPCAEPEDGLPEDSLDVWVVPEDGGDGTASPPIRITFAAGMDANPTWGKLSDGTNLIAFSSKRNVEEDVWAVEVDADGTSPRNERNLTQTPGVDDGYSAWKPDGTAIAFFSNRDGNDEVYTMNPDGTGQTRRTVNGAEDQAPSWSPDFP